MSAADTARVPDAVLADIYRAILAPDAWQRILAILTPLLGGNASVHVRLDRVHPRESRFLVHGIDPQYLPAMARRDLSEDLIWRELLARPAGTVFRSTDVIPASELQANSLYRRVALPAGMRFSLLAVMVNQPQLFANVCVTRADRDFSDAEVALMRELLGHLQIAMELVERIMLGDAGRQQALVTFDRTGQPVVILDRTGNCLYRSLLAQAILDQEDGIGLRRGRLWFGSIAAEIAFEQALHLALTAAPDNATPQAGEIRVNRRNAALPLAVSVIACNSATDRALLPEGARVLVLIHDASMVRTLPGQRLALLYRLTPAEQRVCEALYESGTIAGAAIRIGIAHQTIRSHLKSIYAKFGVTSHARLMHKLARARWVVTTRDTAVPAAET